MNEKYNIHPDFKMWANFHPPLNKPTIKFLQNLMGLSYFKEQSDTNVIVEKLRIPFGKKEIRAIFYTPVTLQTPSPCLVYFHGGGFVLPGAPYHYNNCRKYATFANCKVLYVDYPLAPKNQHPVPMDACFGAYRWVIENANALGINKEKVAVGGDSAGGTFSSVITPLAIKNDITKPCGQMLIYPAVMMDKQTESMKKFTDTPLCNSRDCKKYEKLYFAKPEDRDNEFTSGVCNAEFSVYPPSYVETAEFDCLRDNGMLFAEKLQDAGVDAETNYTSGTIHAYDMVENSPITQKSLEKRILFLKKIFK